MLPMLLARCDELLGRETKDYLQRPVSQTIIEQVYVTTSGVFTVPPLQALLAVFGIDRILFSVDHPYSPNEKGRAFLDGLPLAPADRARIAHGNADRLLRLNV